MLCIVICAELGRSDKDAPRAATTGALLSVACTVRYKRVRLASPERMGRAGSGVSVEEGWSGWHGAREPVRLPGDGKAVCRKRLVFERVCVDEHGLHDGVLEPQL